MNPLLTRGCGLSAFCSVLTPYGPLIDDSAVPGLTPPDFLVPSARASNTDDTQSPDTAFRANTSIDNSAERTWARWTLAAPTAVPTPGTAWAVAAALGALALTRRRRAQR